MQEAIVSAELSDTLREGLQNVDEQARVPFSDVELVDAYHYGMRLYSVPPGSLRTFAAQDGFDSLMGDIAHEYPRSSFETSMATTYVLAFPCLYLGSCGLPLSKQKDHASPFSILTPYEIAHMSMTHRSERQGVLFSGEARTENEVNMGANHLHDHPLTTIMYFDGRGSLRVKNGYANQVSPRLGVMVGIRRTLG